MTIYSSWLADAISHISHPHGFFIVNWELTALTTYQTTRHKNNILEICQKRFKPKSFAYLSSKQRTEITFLLYTQIWAGAGINQADLKLNFLFK